MNILCVGLANIFHIVAILLIGENLLELTKREGNKIINYCEIIFLSMCNSLPMIKINATFELVFFLLCLYIIAKTYFVETNSRIIVYVIGCSIAMESIDMFFSQIITTIKEVQKISITGLTEIITSVLSLIFVIVIVILLRGKNLYGMKMISVKSWIIITTNIIVNFCVLAMLNLMTLKQVAYKNRIAYIIMYLVVASGLTIQVMTMIVLLISRNIQIEREKIIKKYLEEQNNYYEYLKEREVETKKFRHDIRSHLYLLDKVYKEGKCEEFEIYLNDIKDKVDRLGIKVNVGNDIVNAILDKYFAEAKSKNVKLKVQGHFPMGCNVSAYHLCTIFSNLLSNAIEAAQKAENKEVWVICSYTEKNIIIEVGNYFSGFSDNRKKLITTKKEKQYHGWGIKNVKDSVKECEGLMDIEIQEDSFIVSITLKNEGSKNEYSNSR